MDCNAKNGVGAPAQQTQAQPLPPLAIATRTPEARTHARRAFMRLSAKQPSLHWRHVALNQGGMLLVDHADIAQKDFIVREIAQEMARQQHEEFFDWLMMGDWADGDSAARGCLAHEWLTQGIAQ